MTKQEAIEAMKSGKKITHRYFDKADWMTMVDGHIIFEDGISIEEYLFWQYRKTKGWEDGYEILQDNK